MYCIQKYSTTLYNTYSKTNTTGALTVHLQGVAKNKILQFTLQFIVRSGIFFPKFSMIITWFVCPCCTNMMKFC